MKRAAILLGLGVFLTVSCGKREQEPQFSNIYIVGSWYEPEVGETKSSSTNFKTGIWDDYLRTAITTGNLLHLLENMSSQYENNHLKNSTGGEYIAKLWKNEEMQNLSNNYSLAYSVYVSDSVVYVAGSEIPANNKGKSIAKLWKNGREQNLTDGTFNAFASSVYVSDGDVYVVGSDWNYEKQNWFVKLWINGVTQNLSSGDTWMNATSIYVSGDDVYVCGFEIPDVNKGIGIAKLWKNGREQNLTDGRINSMATSVCVYGNNVYVTGYEGNNARLWKNGVLQNLNNGATIASSVFVSNGDVYVAGYDIFVPDMKIWKNGNVLYKMDGKYYVKSIFVSGSDVYVVANETTFQNTAISTAKLWKNGVMHDISNGSTRSEANCVFVK